PLSLVAELEVVRHLNSALTPNRLELIFTVVEFDHPSQPCRREILAIARPRSTGASVQEQLDTPAIRINLHHLALSFVAPANRPGMSIDMDHGFVRPVGLEKEVSFLGGDPVVVNYKDKAAGAFLAQIHSAVGSNKK